VAFFRSIAESVTASAATAVIPKEVKENLNNLVNALRFMNSQNIEIDYKISTQMTQVANAVKQGATNDDILKLLVKQYGTDFDKAIGDTVKTIDRISNAICKDLYNNDKDKANPAVQALIGIEKFAKNDTVDGKVDRSRRGGGPAYESSADALVD
jgi:hypothetical protein